MRKNKFLAATALSLLASTANAASIWIPTSPDTDFLTLSFAGIDLNGAMLGLFDDSQIGSYEGSYLLIGNNVGGEVRFTANTPDTSASSYTSTDVLRDGPFTLTGSSQFTLAVSYDSGMTWFGDTSFEVTDSPDSYLIHFDDTVEGDAAIIASDLAPSTAVPVPAAVWLFGAGLLGLVGVARRKA